MGISGRNDPARPSERFDSSPDIRYGVGTSFQEGTMLVGHLLPPSPTRGRRLSLDVFRGMVIAAMILVTDPGIDDYVSLGLRCEINLHLMGDVYVLKFREDCSRLFSEPSRTCMK
jgi:hypothetical protein